MYHCTNKIWCFLINKRVFLVIQNLTDTNRIHQHLPKNNIRSSGYAMSYNSSNVEISDQDHIKDHMLRSDIDLNNTRILMGCGNRKTPDILDVAVVTPANILFRRNNYNTAEVDKAIRIGNSSFIYNAKNKHRTSHTIGFGNTPEIYIDYEQGDIYDSYNLPDQSGTASEFLSALRLSARVDSGLHEFHGLLRCGRHSARNTEHFAENYQIYFYSKSETQN